MKIKMLSSHLGSRDGVFAQMYIAGEVHDLTHTDGERDLAAVFVREGWAEPVKPEAQEASPDPRSPDPPPQAGTSPKQPKAPKAPKPR